jgi:hypothetical protein
MSLSRVTTIAHRRDLIRIWLISCDVDKAIIVSKNSRIALLLDCVIVGLRYYMYWITTCADVNIFN